MKRIYAKLATDDEESTIINGNSVYSQATAEKAAMEINSLCDHFYIDNVMRIILSDDSGASQKWTVYCERIVKYDAIKEKDQ